MEKIALNSKQIGYVLSDEGLVLKTPFTMEKEGLGKYWREARTICPYSDSHIIFTKDGPRYDRVQILHNRTPMQISWEAAMDRDNRAWEILSEIRGEAKKNPIKTYQLAAELAHAEVEGKGWKGLVEAHRYYMFEGNTHGAKDFHRIMRRVYAVNIFRDAPRSEAFKIINPLQPMLDER
ncbi:MAG: hypothetical protein WCV81_04105 [Microgenomates group bacterium]|jgi:hypothetical protein